MIGTLIGYSIITGIIGGILIDIGHQTLGQPIVYAAEPEAPREVLIEAKIDWTPERIQQEIQQRAEEYNVSAEVMSKVIKCESNGSTTVQSFHKRPDGSREQSFGLVQIHLPDWPEVSYEDATNPAFAIQFLAEKLSEGRGNLWTCYRELY